MANTIDYHTLLEEQPIITTPFLLELLDSALIQNIEEGNIQEAYSVLDLSVSLASTLNDHRSVPGKDGRKLLNRVKHEMERGNIAQAKQHMVEFALR